ncbi:SLC13 family permease [Paenibacillus illinoisensis]|uniref:SLC13 family permease n=1 Tax=Paenibacillus illinoisensis TaxID=59845 RepID=UPI003D26F220
MSLLAISGFIMMIVLVFVLLRNLLTPNVVFVVLPTIAAIVCGYSLKEIGGFVGDGLVSVLNTATLLAFAIIFFTIMKEVGVFNVIVKFIMRFLNNSVFSVLVVSLIIAAICSLDGNAYATLLVTVPALMPIYDQMKISRKSLFLCVVIGVGATGVTPWGGSLLRAVAVTHVDPIALYYSLLPIQGVILVLGIICLYFVSKIETRNGAGISDADFKTFKTTHIEQNLSLKQENAKKMLPFNFILLIAVLTILILNIIPSYYLFMLAVAVAIPLNYPKTSDAQKKIKDYGATVVPVMITFLSIGAFLGIMEGTGIFKDMVSSIVSMFPSSFGPYIYIVVAAFSVPIVIALGSDAFYFALLPLVAGVASQFQVSAESVTHALLITEQIGLLLSPAIPATYLGLSLLGLNIGEHVKYSFKWAWGISIGALIMAFVFGILHF